MIEFPQSAKFGRRITLALFKKRGASPRVAKWIKSVVWAYKLAPNTINLAATTGIKEIEVLDVVLREDCSTKRSRSLVVEMFSLLIANPCIIRLYGEDGDELGVAVCPKLSAGTLYGDSAAYRSVFRLGSTDVGQGQDPWAGVTTLETFLIRLAAALAEMRVVPGESLKDFIVRHYKVESLRADLGDLERKISRETQLDVKYQLSKDKQKLQKEIEKCQNLST